MRALTFLWVFLLAAVSAQAQNEININTTASVLVPSDQISFRITINAEADTPQQAYELHKKREKMLVNLLKKHKINERDIKFEPVSINRVNEGRYDNKEREYIRTRQTVVLTMDNFDLYEKIQLTLIENDFDEFSGNFMSSKTEQGEEQALKKALKLARSKAETISSETGLTISGIKNISYSYRQGPPQPMREMAAMKSSDSLMEFAQTVSVTASVSVSYGFE